MKRPVPIFFAVLILTVVWHPWYACAGAVGLAPVWRFWSPALGRHFYTIDEAERDKLLSEYAAVWTYEEVAYRAFSSADHADLAPVYRFWSGSLSAHFYTLDESERDKLLSNYPHVWTYEGVAFYACPPGRQPAGTMPVYRFWSGVLGAHFYTAGDAERFKLLSGYRDTWQYEGVAWYAWPPAASAPVSVLKGPYVPQVTANSAAIMWETDGASDSRVDYGMVTPDGAFAYNPALVTLHKVVLTGLAPGTVYTYRVTSGDLVGPTGSFATAPPASQPFRFVVYGDSRTYPATHGQVVQSIISSAPAVVFHTGDLVGSGRNYQAWQPELFAPAGELMIQAPVVPVLGNHEYVGTGALWYFYFFDLPLDEGWWAMTYGNTRFVGLDTNVAYGPGSPQYEWLMQEFASAAYLGATWHVVIFHHPPFTSTAGHSDNIILQNTLVPLFESFGVDIAFQGHSHAYERYLHHGVHYIVTGGGGAPLYPLVVDLVPPIRLAGLSAYHHCVVDVDPLARTLTVAATDLAGQVFDTVHLSK
jgi:hypothetical protein